VPPLWCPPPLHNRSGQAGGQFAYYLCLKRHHREGCDLPYLPAFEVEQRLEHGWPLWVRLDGIDAEAIAQGLHKELARAGEARVETERQAQERLAPLDAERLQLVQMGYAGAIPIDFRRCKWSQLLATSPVGDRMVWLAATCRSVSHLNVPPEPRSRIRKNQDRQLLTRPAPEGALVPVRADVLRRTMHQVNPSRAQLARRSTGPAGPGP
jgi:hypothetical protein